MSEYSIAISYGKNLGWIDYDGAGQSATVNIADDEAKGRVEAFLAAKHTIGVPHESLTDFTQVEIDPLKDVESFKLAITRLWEETQVNVDWSRPVDYVKEHPSY